MTFLAFAESSIQLVPDGTIFLHIALILIMMWILNRTLFKPINRILETRSGKTGGRSGEARELLLKVEESMTRYEQGLREARAEGYRIVEETRRKALAKRQQQIDAVRAEIEQQIASEKNALQTQIAQARTQLERDAQTIATRISSNVLHRPVREAA